MSKKFSWPDEQVREDWRLRLALLKESRRYRDFWEEHGGDKLRNALKDIRNFFSSLPDGMGLEDSQLKEYQAKCGQGGETLQKFDWGALALFNFRSGLSEGYNGKPPNEKFNALIEVLDPKNEEIPERLPVCFEEWPAIVLAETAKNNPKEGAAGLQLEHILRCLKPSERLVRIDLSRKRGELIDDFKRFLDSVDFFRERKDLPTEWQENYKQWEPDNSRFRLEAWQALKVWQLRRQRKTYGEIARILKIKLSTTKMAFQRAYELIEGRCYEPEVFKREHAEIKFSELRKTCETCPIRETCTELCPDVLYFVEQDDVKQHDLSLDEIEYRMSESDYDNF